MEKSTIVYMSLYQLIQLQTQKTVISWISHDFPGFVGLWWWQRVALTTAPRSTKVPRLGRPGAARLIRAATASRNTRNRARPCLRCPVMGMWPTDAHGDIRHPHVSYVCLILFVDSVIVWYHMISYDIIWSWSWMYTIWGYNGIVFQQRYGWLFNVVCL